ncbi:MAG TPA: Ppx/GppA phosphatase family protein [Caulobacteraceae bacterium]|nr:Ppx/GppA phosphatase family protein [Caulobacteraceae bacterium]
MNDAPAAAARARRPNPGDGEICAALDLGTNNCRLLLATPWGRGFRVVDSYSRIVRLGEGLSQSGRMARAAMDRALAALSTCADKIARRGATRVRAVATEACRTAANGAAFLAEAEARTGLRLTVISPKEEARLAVAGCLDLVDPTAKAALILDVGGGSTEISWLDLQRGKLVLDPRHRDFWRPPMTAWLSMRLGVVTLAERFPTTPDPEMSVYRQMVETVKAEVARSSGADALREVFEAGDGHLVGTSGAITSLAGLHLRLPRYNRAMVDGLWMTRADCEATAAQLARLTVAERAAEPCIGPDRADLVLAGAAILQAIQEIWPCARVRVADRGLREGLLLSLMARNEPWREAGGQDRGARA